ncbi:BRCA1-associated RING domain protein 1 [Colletotrichum orbiculare MAFF 240422]|uniref:BRCA1-associated RING domain protein 1 n=1 Tax=Colletotrichum orbiculare (strain 104-T / ATCC 96160 / CBS 514.97 / LARS 414 / MAFF 240422) TaxID=1213857 RepID=A0A484FAF7_COLOR|nr:BRCA1-associated RING domain protein 1 [Colletotrichum orbiculare MAFF 240422]
MGSTVDMSPRHDEYHIASLERPQPTDRALYVSVGANPAEHDDIEEDDDLELIEDMRSRRKWTEATETLHISEADCGYPGGLHQSRIDWVLSATVQGQVEEVRHYSESSRDAGILLHGVEAHEEFQLDDSDSRSYGGNDSPGTVAREIETTGETALHFAACEASSAVVRLLLQKGADPNARDTKGSVPLMRAALWGRLENVEALLDYGADKNVACVHRGQPMWPADFARPLSGNEEQRYVVSGGERQFHKEHVSERDLDRARILLLLRGGREEAPLNQPELSSFALAQSSQGPNFPTLLWGFDRPDPWKTVAVMWRGGGFPPTAAMSGWTSDQNASTQIGGREWTTEVLKLCRLTKYLLTPHPNDKGVCGRYNACHAEKQLVTYFVTKHCFVFKGERVEEQVGMGSQSLREISDATSRAFGQGQEGPDSGVSGCLSRLL